MRSTRSAPRAVGLLGPFEEVSLLVSVVGTPPQAATASAVTNAVTGPSIARASARALLLPEASKRILRASRIVGSLHALARRRNRPFKLAQAAVVEVP